MTLSLAPVVSFVSLALCTSLFGFPGSALGAGPAGPRRAAGAKPRAVKPIQSTEWGQSDGRDVDLYTLTNTHGLVARIATYGATLVELHVPDRTGSLGDVVLGSDNLADFLRKPQYFGATIGRVANRVAGAKFELGGKTYALAANNGPSSLHGGKRGWDKVVWTAAAKETPKGPSLVLSYVSKDGEEGYPGTVRATTTYTLTNDDALQIEMTATTDAPTPVAMANHTYWNLHAGAGGDILDHVLTLRAQRYTPGMPPDGKVLTVAGTPFDFTKGKPIGRDLKAAGPAGPGAPIGYDHNFVVDGDPHALRPVARVEDPKSGRVMTVQANQPGVQVYAGLFLDGSSQGKGRTHDQHGAFCLETQTFPNAINVPAWRKDAVLEPGQTYRHVMILKFSVK